MTEVTPGIDAIPLRPDEDDTPHVYWVRGSDGGALIDAGYSEPERSQALIRAIHELRGGGAPPHLVLLTDRFGEHVDGAVALKREFPGLRVLAGGPDVDAINEAAGETVIDESIRNGMELPLGAEPGRVLRAIATPGHTPGSTCYWLESDRVLFSGDCVLAEGTTAVQPSGGGDMAAYVASLRVLSGLNARMLLSFHGAPVMDPEARLRDLIGHRDGRDADILQALADGVTDIDTMRDRLYAAANLPEWRWNAAREQILAHLIKLESEGRAVEVESGRVYRLP